jgi:hypothetical protein
LDGALNDFYLYGLGQILLSLVGHRNGVDDVLSFRQRSEAIDDGARGRHPAVDPLNARRLGLAGHTKSLVLGKSGSAGTAQAVSVYGDGELEIVVQADPVGVDGSLDTKVFRLDTLRRQAEDTEDETPTEPAGRLIHGKTALF